MKFQYLLTGAGWAQCELEINSKKYSFGAGYLTGALGDFLPLFPFCICEIFEKKAKFKNEDDHNGLCLEKIFLAVI